ncbi:MAG: tetratricopeptide repeat protein [Bacteroidales bacterium]|nr:tetratricopeptide repeat protein [Bacteroidales bacterium]
MISIAEIEKAKTLLDENKIEQAIDFLKTLVEDTQEENKDVAYYVLGNAYRRGNNWQDAINSYSRSVEINPSSPAKEMRESCIKILDFYNKDMYNP